MTTSDGTNRIRVLLVDDSITDRTRAAGLIRKHHADWDVTAVAGVSDALEEMAVWQPDVVVSDLVMPDIDGRAFLKMIRRDFPTVPVVLITSQGDDQIAAECVAMGAANYVPKRLMAKQLTAVLEEVVQSDEEMRATRRVLKYVAENDCSFQIKSDPDQIHSLVSFLRERLRGTQIFRTKEVSEMMAGVREALLNAHFHGNLQITSGPQQPPATEHPVPAHEQQKMADDTDHSIRLAMTLDPETICFRVSDDGPGFDVTSLQRLSGEQDEQFVSGNGIRSMRTSFESVTWNDKGNEVTLSRSVEDAIP